MSEKENFLVAARWCKTVEALSVELGISLSRTAFYVNFFGINELPYRPSKRSAKEILNAVSQESGISIADLKGPSRKPEIVRHRDECFRQIRAQGYSFPQIGNMFGRHHTTVIHALKKGEEKSVETAS